METIPISVVILTYNEAANIERCLRSVAWSSDIIVLDSFSTDGTPDLAVKKGAKVLYRQFDNYAAQRNYALKKIHYMYPWVLMLDADEAVPSELAEEMGRAVENTHNKTTMYQLRRKDYFMGTWIRRCTNYNSLWIARLLRPDYVWVERSINEEYHTDGAINQLENALLHFPFRKGMSAWIDKHNRYSSMEAELIFGQGAGNWSFADLLFKGPVARRKALKAIMFSTPGRPLLMFIGRYIVCGGFLDGRAGLTFCMLKTYYEYMIDCKVRELRFRAREQQIYSK